ncbi:MAG: hypothetical protein U0R78_05075 [Nocardioidaceae bacterium]
MAQQYWFLSVGPFDEEGVAEWTAGLRQREGEPPEIELIHHRQWFARAMDADTVREALVVLHAGIAATSAEGDSSPMLGLVGDMETWLEREFDPRMG